MDKFKEQKDRLVWARQEAGFSSAAEAAVALGVKVSTYNSHENGWRAFNPVASKKYGKKFGVRWQWLYDGEGEPVEKINLSAAKINSSDTTAAQQSLGKTVEGEMPKQRFLKLLDKLSPERQLHYLLQLMDEVEEEEERQSRRPTDQRA